jgi:hypothetical protein
MGEQIELTGSSLMRITYRYRNVNKPEDTLNLYAAGSRRHYAEVNGLTEFTVKEQFYTRVSQALDVIFTEEAFEIEW